MSKEEGAGTTAVGLTGGDNDSFTGVVEKWIDNNEGNVMSASPSVVQQEEAHYGKNSEDIKISSKEETGKDGSTRSLDRHGKVKMAMRDKNSNVEENKDNKHKNSRNNPSDTRSQLAGRRLFDFNKRSMTDMPNRGMLTNWTEDWPQHVLTSK